MPVRLLPFVHLGRLVGGGKTPASAPEEACQVGREDARTLTNGVVSRRPRRGRSVSSNSVAMSTSGKAFQTPAVVGVASLYRSLQQYRRRSSTTAPQGKQAPPPCL
jgi:hypothetical protein